MEYIAKTEAERLTLRHLAQLIFHQNEKIEKISAFDGENSVEVCIEGKTKSVRERVSLDLSLHTSLARGKNAALGKAFFLAAKEFTDYTPPYGNLFGVRPVKVPLFYLEQGLEESKVTELLQKEFFVSQEKAVLLTELAKKEISFAQTLGNRDGMLYVSIPFCPSRCNYCSFISASAPKHLALIPTYLSLLKEEIKKVGVLIRQKEKKLRAIYIGGGTPGVLNEKELDELLTALEESFSFGGIEEFCVEIGRPDTVTKEKLDILKSAGVQRISINPQSTNNATLSRIGRHHSAECYYEAMELAGKYGFSSVNCDLIAGLDGETPKEFLDSVEKVLSFAPENLTIHALCQKRAAEKRSAFLSGEAFREAMDTAHAKCRESGLFPYYLYRQKNAVADLENLGFCKNGKECIYNIAMMEDLCDVFAVGAGAITKIVPRKKGGKILRFAAYKYPYEYLSDPKKIGENLKELQEVL